ncbi:MAG: radical SAM protein, partial [bacterium]
IENIIRENLTLYFELETHPVIFENRELLEKMIQAKFLRYTMGCESGSNSLLKRMGRNSNSRQIIGSVKRIVESGGIVLTSWISNLPGESDSEFKETQDLMYNVVKVGGFIYWIENLHVLPGSQLYEKPQSWDIEVLLNNLEDWIRWSIFSKKYVNFDEVYKEPLNYLTHLNRNVSPKEMIDRFYSNRKLAFSLTPEMKSNLKNRFKNLNSDIVETEMQALDWYEKEGWTLWLF